MDGNNTNSSYITDVRFRKEGEMFSHDGIKVKFNMSPEKFNYIKNYHDIFRDDSVAEGTEFRDYITKIYKDVDGRKFVMNYLIDKEMRVFEIKGSNDGYISRAYHRCAPGLETEIIFVEGFCCGTCGLIDDN